MARRRIRHDMASAYVYAITIDGLVRYIGKGRRYRVREHLRVANFLLSGRRAGKKIKANRFYNRLAAAMSAGSLVDELIFQDGLTDEGAFALERKLIAECPKGQLWNVAPGGEGFSSQFAKKMWTPELRAQQSERSKRYWSNPENRRKHGETIRGQWQDPEYRENHIDKQKKRWSNPELRKRNSELHRALWLDASYKAKSIEGRRWWTGSPECRSLRSAQSKARWKDPEFRARMSKIRREMWTPEMRAAKRRQTKMRKRDSGGRLL